MKLFFQISIDIILLIIVFALFFSGNPILIVIAILIASGLFYIGAMLGDDLYQWIKREEALKEWKKKYEK